jgi:hypothetical protein
MMEMLTIQKLKFSKPIFKSSAHIHIAIFDCLIQEGLIPIEHMIHVNILGVNSCNDSIY